MCIICMYRVYIYECMYTSNRRHPHCSRDRWVRFRGPRSSEEKFDRGSDGHPEIVAARTFMICDLRTRMHTRITRTSIRVCIY